MYSKAVLIFYEDEDVREHILYLAVEDWWVLDIWSFVSGLPSSLNIKALEDSTILYIDRAKKEKLYKEIAKVEKLFRRMNQKIIGICALSIIRLCRAVVITAARDQQKSQNQNGTDRFFRKKLEGKSRSLHLLTDKGWKG